MKSISVLLAASFLASSPSFSALPDDAKVPVLTYHSWEVRYDPITETCDVESEALARDLKVIYEEGYTVIPAYWLAEWVLGWRDGFTLPEKSVVITMDDGHDLDFLSNALPDHPCAPIRSMTSVLEESSEWEWNAEEGMPVPHATTFVIASPMVRNFISPDNHMMENWWPSAAIHPLMEVQNHGLDHDHETIIPGSYDETLSSFINWDITLPAGGGEPQMKSTRIDTFEESAMYVQAAGEYISMRIGMGTDLFAYPFGPASDYMIDVYMPVYDAMHVAAFCAGGEYVTKQSNPFCLGRFIHRSSLEYGGWRSTEELRQILRAD